MSSANGVKCTIALAVLFASGLAANAGATEIGLHNAMSCPISVQLVSTFDGSVTDVRLGRNQSRTFLFRSPEYVVRVIPLDRTDTVFQLGRMPLRQHALRLGRKPLVLHGQFQKEVCLDGFVRDVRVAVHLDVGADRVTALAPGYEIADSPQIVYLLPVLVR